jgi:hypothetical protein
MGRGFAKGFNESLRQMRIKSAAQSYKFALRGVQ